MHVYDLYMNNTISHFPLIFMEHENTILAFRGFHIYVILSYMKTE